MNHRNKIKTHHKSRISRTVILALVAVLLIGGGVYAFYMKRQDDNSSKAATDTAQTDDEYINLEPATPEDKAAAERNKQEILDGEENEEPADGQRGVKPVISFAGPRSNEDFVEVRSYVAEVYESNGHCTSVFTKGSEKVERTVEGIKDATYTRCDRVVVPLDEFSSGTWSLVVSYKSPSASGSSESREVSIP